jgi:glutathione S-transferase
MRLLYTPFSPFSRKVIVSAHEKDLHDQIEKVLTEVGTHVPLETEVHDHLSRTTPLMKIPVLIDGDLTIFDSRVIVEYLDSLSEHQRLLPEAGRARWLALKQQSIADGLMDAAILCRFEITRAPSRWPEWERAQKRRILQSADALNLEFANPSSDIDVGTISAACALGYLDFRFDDLEWRKGRPALSEWFAHIEARPSMQATRPDKSGF